MTNKDKIVGQAHEKIGELKETLAALKEKMPVRCCECKYNLTENRVSGREPGCTKLIQVNDNNCEYMHEFFDITFCSRGVRRTE